MKQQRRNTKKKTVSKPRKIKKKRRDFTAKYFKAMFVVFGIVFLVACLATQMPEAETPKASQKSDSIQNNKRRRALTGSYDDFRKEVLQRDRVLLEKYRKAKQERRLASQQDDSFYHYRDRIEDLENQLRSDLLKKSLKKKGTIGWDIVDQVKKLKSDSLPK